MNNVVDVERTEVMNQDDLKRVMNPDHPQWEVFKHILLDINTDCPIKSKDGTCCSRENLDAIQRILRIFWDVDIEATLDYFRSSYCSCSAQLAEMILSDKNHDPQWARTLYKLYGSLRSLICDYYVAGLEKGIPREQTRSEVKELADKAVEDYYQHPEFPEALFKAMNKNYSKN